jgi:hypothetical protein
MRETTKKANNILYKNKSDLILQILFLLCVSLAIWGITIYRMTIIDIKYLFIITTIGTVVAFILIKKILKSSYSNFWICFVSIGIGGGLFYFGVLFINKQFADKELFSEQFVILKTGTLGRGKSSSCSQPYAIIDFNGTEKELVFYCDYAEIIKHSKNVALTYSKGALGFNIIKSKQFADQLLQATLGPMYQYSG